MQQVDNENSEDNKIPILKRYIVNAVSNEEEIKRSPTSIITRIKLLQMELDLLDYIHILRLSLQINLTDFNQALELLEQINELKVNSYMLIKHQYVVDTIEKVTKYIGNKNILDLTKKEAIKYTKKTFQIRYKAQTVLNKFKSLFTVLDGQTFQEVYDKELQYFLMKTKHLSLDQIYGSTSDSPFHN